MKKITSAYSPLLQANFIKKIFPLFIVMLMLTISSHAQKTSSGNGSWNVATTWIPFGVPGSTDDVTIAIGNTVTVPANAFCKRLYISGTLDMSGASGITMDVSNNSVASNTNGLQLNAGGTLNIGATNTLKFSNIDVVDAKDNGILLNKIGGKGFYNVVFENITVDGTGREFPFNNELKKNWPRGFGLLFIQNPAGNGTYCNMVYKNRGGTAIQDVDDGQIGSFVFTELKDCKK